MHENPKVSVIMSTFNGESYLREAVSSVLNNGYSNLEFLIIDDGSSDSCYSLLEMLADSDSRIRLFRNIVNRGTGYSFSFLLSKVEGDFIAAIGQDDKWEVGFLKESMEVLKEKNNVAVVFSDVQIIDSKGAVLPSASSSFRMHYLQTMTREDLMIYLVMHNFLCACAGVLRADLIKNWHTIGDNDQYQDWNLWQYLILRGDFHLITKKLICYRVHGSNLSISGINPMQVQVESWQTRLAMLGYPEFGEYVMATPNPNAVFYAVMTAYSSVPDLNDGLKYFCLLQCLRRNERYFKDLESFWDIMAMLFLYTGSMAKVRRYLSKDIFEKLQCPPAFWKEFSWKYFICITGDSMENSRSPFIRYRKIGPVNLIKVLLRKGNGMKISVLFRKKGMSLDRNIEWYLYNRYRFDIRKVWAYMQSVLAGKKARIKLVLSGRKKDKEHG